jgi:thioesterase domain-containing protein
MAAAELFARIGKELGLTAPLSALYEASTPRMLAKKLAGGTGQNDWKSLVPISPSGSRPPLFMVHGGGGNVLMFRELGRLMAPDYPFYALQAQGLDGSKFYLKSVEEMAARYLKEIRELQPEGPYYLGGFCVGGQVAFEMAQRLIQNGQQVNLLAVIDTYNFNGVTLRLSPKEHIHYTAQKIKFHFVNIMRLDLKSKISYFTEKLSIALRREMGRWRVRMNPRRDNLGSREEFIEDVNDRAFYAYAPSVYPGKMTVYKPWTNYAILSDPSYGWGEVAVGGLEVIDLPVDPGGIFVEPYVQTLAQKLKQEIDQGVSNRAEVPVIIGE